MDARAQPGGSSGPCCGLLHGHRRQGRARRGAAGGSAATPRALAARVRDHLPRACFSPGEPLGIIGAQSLGETDTQMTLNTFHGAGVSEKSNVNQGVPRLKEILRATANMKAPSLTVVPVRQRRGDAGDAGDAKGEALALRNSLTQTRLADILTRSEIAYLPHNAAAPARERRTALDAACLARRAAADGRPRGGSCRWSSTRRSARPRRAGTDVSSAIYDWLGTAYAAESTSACASRRTRPTRALDMTVGGRARTRQRRGRREARPRPAPTTPGAGARADGGRDDDEDRQAARCSDAVRRSRPTWSTR